MPRRRRHLSYSQVIILVPVTIRGATSHRPGHDSGQHVSRITKKLFLSVSTLLQFLSYYCSTASGGRASDVCAPPVQRRTVSPNRETHDVIDEAPQNQIPSTTEVGRLVAHGLGLGQQYERCWHEAQIRGPGRRRSSRRL